MRRELRYRYIKAFLVSRKGGIVYCGRKKKARYVALPEPVRSTVCTCDQPIKSQNSSSMPTNERHGLVESHSMLTLTPKSSSLAKTLLRQTGQFSICAAHSLHART